MRGRDAGRTRLAWATVALVLGTVLMATQAAAALLDGPTETDLGIELSDDDAAAALFSATELAPGAPVAACLAIAFRSSGAAALRLHGRSEGPTLAPRLQLVVEAGVGGRFGSCDGFAGTSIYRGTLEDFAARHHDYASGLPIAVPDASAFRLTVEVVDDNAAQGSEAGATFTWEARAVPPGSQTTETTVTPPAATPTTVTSTTSAPVVGTTATATSGAPTPTGSHEPAPLGEPAPSSRRAKLIPRGEPRGDSLFQAIWRGAVFVLERAAFPGLLLVVAGIFLLVQDRIDRKDPKLALAPVHPDPDLRFER